ncbi:hypothetical protein DCS_03034 [Drechmeria coniospora]|uniref:Uncharacterized protein n=1 Tax=Drechmeria coniospora TaxID=98403 RepID=A0A151GXT1_DRECN|nr:hypothetical protein DCS_03034 [Drechmeria coniospora]KYK61890.1 hypothetical protein DCS_03034 [Drechmeria coniospora]
MAKQGGLVTFGFSDNGSKLARPCRPQTIPPPSDSRPMIFGQLLRNVFVDDDDDILGLIDGEFAHAGPTQSSSIRHGGCCLTRQPCAGVYKGETGYRHDFRRWKGGERDGHRFFLPTYLRESWPTGHFWLNHAARKSWAIDVIYRKYLGECN